MFLTRSLAARLNIESKITEIKELENHNKYLMDFDRNNNLQIDEISRHIERIAHIWRMVRPYNPIDAACGKLIYVNLSSKLTFKGSIASSSTL